MKLHVIFVNKLDAYCDMQHLGQSTEFKYRHVEIELTPDQVESIQPKVVGKHLGMQVKEEINLCFLQ